MGEQNREEFQPEDIPEAVVQSRFSQLSIVWIIPLVAALIGAWLIYKAQSEKGPTITISFQTAEGLEAGKTKIKYKEVDLGQVQKISLNSDLSQVVVTAKLLKQAEALVSKNTRFWVVKARINVSGVSGIGTLFSGVYIGMDPGKPGRPARSFTGLEEPPIVTTDLPGRHFVLKAEKRGSLDTTSPVYFRNIRVGQVVGYQLASDGQSVTIKVFINSPYHRFVYKNSRFWNASGLDLSIGSEGVQLNTESMVTMLVGGISFDVPSYLETGGPAPADQIFNLYENYTASQEKTYQEKTYWVLYFDGSVRGLSPGAQVEFRGIKIGKVVDINLEFDVQGRDFRIPVLVEIEPERFIPTAELTEEEERRTILDFLVEKGLRAQLKIGNLITGQQLVSFDIFPKAPSQQIAWTDPYPEFPTVPTPIEEISSQVSYILTKLTNMPLEQIGNDLRDTVKSTKQLMGAPELHEAALKLNALLNETQLLVGDLRTGVTPDLAATLAQAKQSLTAVETTLNEDSPLQVNLNSALIELIAAARSLRALTDYLERHPQALIYGKKKDQ